MKTTLMLLLTLIAIESAAQEIAGTVLDEKKEPLISAVVQVYQGGILKGGNITDYDGRYLIKPIDPGCYDVLVTFTGYDSMMTTHVVVPPGGRVTQNFAMSRRSTDNREAFMIKAFKKKLVDQDNPGKHVMTADEIKTLPTTEIADVGYAAPGPGYIGRGRGVILGGARTGTQYIVDGVQVQQGRAQFYDPSEESYKKQHENDFMNVSVSPLSTMSVDVDRASYSNIRRFINEGRRPPVDAVRVEEMINYFDYDYPQPTGKDPIAIQTELTNCPWQKQHKLLHIGMQAAKINTNDLPPSNMVFLIDVSGSMESPERLPLLVAGMKLLVQNLRAVDKVSIVTYAGNAGLALSPTSGDHKQQIIDALDRLQAGGSTAGGAGIKLAYKTAQDNFIKGGNNRVLLATDGDFNVGVSSDNELEDLITKERATGVYLTCLGFGTDNYKDAKMEMMADKGNGNYDYIDNILEAQKTLVHEFGGTLFTVAKDVKAQIEFNPAKVKGYRLVGYENRMLNTEDFKDDKKDAGDMGAGHTVTIIYELIPVGVQSEYMRDADSLKYQKPQHTTATYTDELATIKFRYKKPDEEVSKEMVQTIADNTLPWEKATENTRFSESVAMFGMLLKESKYKGSSSYDDVVAMAGDSKHFDSEGYRAEFVRLVKAAKQFEPNLSKK
jgi:Ca-activated chloride channel family protein